jgi:hypothetical protein
MPRKASMQAIRACWREHAAAPFPRGLAGQEVAGIDLALLDTIVAGCVSTFLDRKGTLDTWRTATLGLCYRHLTVVVKDTDRSARIYFARLEELARLVLEAVQERTRPAGRKRGTDFQPRL